MGSRCCSSSSKGAPVRRSPQRWGSRPRSCECTWRTSWRSCKFTRRWTHRRFLQPLRRLLPFRFSRLRTFQRTWVSLCVEGATRRCRWSDRLRGAPEVPAGWSAAGLRRIEPITSTRIRNASGATEGLADRLRGTKLSRCVCGSKTGFGRDAEPIAREVEGCGHDAVGRDHAQARVMALGADARAAALAGHFVEQHSARHSPGVCCGFVRA